MDKTDHLLAEAVEKLEKIEKALQQNLMAKLLLAHYARLLTIKDATPNSGSHLFSMLQDYKAVSRLFDQEPPPDLVAKWEQILVDVQLNRPV